jgi:hypothetical protein
MHSRSVAQLNHQVAKPWYLARKKLERNMEACCRRTSTGSRQKKHITHTEKHGAHDLQQKTAVRAHEEDGHSSPLGLWGSVCVDGGTWVGHRVRIVCVSVCPPCSSRAYRLHLTCHLQGSLHGRECRIHTTHTNNSNNTYTHITMADTCDTEPSAKPVLW